MPTEVTGWLATDGSFHQFKADAERVDAIIDLTNLLKTSGVGVGGDWSRDMFSSWLVEKAESLSRILCAVAATNIRKLED